MPGLTTGWLPAPERTAFPLGVRAVFRQMAWPGATVIWDGAKEVHRDAQGSVAECMMDTPGHAAITVRVFDTRHVYLHACKLDVVDNSAADVHVVIRDARVEPLRIDLDHVNASTMSYYFGHDSIASLDPLGPRRYVTSVERTVWLAAQVEPEGFAGLVEWRVDGQPAVLGADAPLRITDAGLHRISAGPPDREETLSLLTYRAAITPPPIVLDGFPVTYTVRTDPPGLEPYVQWLASTKFGTALPVTGRGGRFTVTFSDTWGTAAYTGAPQQWLGVRASNAVIGQDGGGNNCNVVITNCPDMICVDETYTFVAVGTPGGGTYDWSVMQTGGQLTPATGTGASFTVTGTQASAAANDVVVQVSYTSPLGQVCTDSCALTVKDSDKVPLGGGVNGNGNPGCFKVYVPTTWGGKLTVATTAGNIADLKYPDGTAYVNGAETGLAKHGWYSFKVRGAAGGYMVTATFTQEGTINPRPWDYYWWASKADYIREPLVGGNGMADTGKAGGSDDLQAATPPNNVNPGADVVLSGLNGTLETNAAAGDEKRTLINLFDKVGAYQPLVKYDALHSPAGTTPARDWEAANDQTDFEWCGHCLGGAVGSIKLKQPTPVNGTGYNQDELEGLWAELGENANQPTVDGVGGIPPGPPAAGADLTDRFAPDFHRMLETYIKNGMEALYAQLRSDGGDKGEVWNHALYKYSSVYVEAPGGNEKVVKITTEAKANGDYQPPTAGPTDRVVNYVYIIAYTANGVPDPVAMVTDWISVGGAASWAPAAVSLVGQPIWTGDNPNVTEAKVRGDDSKN